MSAQPAGPDAAAAPAWRAPGELELTPILRAALDAFSEAGYHGTSVRDIASRVGVTVPALYYHHENKEAILFSLLDTSITRLHGLCLAAIADAADTPQARFLNLVECVVIYMANAGKSARLDDEIRVLSPELRKIYGARRHEIETMFVQVIESGVQTGVFRVTSPADTARALLGMYQAIPTWFQPGGRLQAPELARRYKDISAHTVGAPPAVITMARARLRPGPG
jgi:AcrR family transcriptional regulator